MMTRHIERKRCPRFRVPEGRRVSAIATREARPDRPARGLTLFELLMVLLVLAVLGTLVLPLLGDRLGRSRADVTCQSLRRIREVVMGTYFDDMGSLPRPGVPGLMAGRVNHPQLGFLFVNPATYEDGDGATAPYDTTFDPVSRTGWRGPYLLHEGNGFRYAVDADREVAGNYVALYGFTGDPTVLDGWGNPIVIQEPDADGDGVIDPVDEARHVRLVSAGPNGVIDTPVDSLTAIDRGDDIVLFLRITDPSF